MKPPLMAPAVQSLKFCSNLTWNLGKSWENLGLQQRVRAYCHIGPGCRRKNPPRQNMYTEYLRTMGER